MLTVTIQRLVSNAVYEDRPYTHTVVARTISGAEISMEANAGALSDNDVGVTIAAEIGAQSMHPIKKIDNDRSNIVPADHDSVDIYGRIISIDPSTQHPLEIQVDNGLIRAYVRDSSGIEIGDHVFISRAQLYLRSLDR